MILSPLAKLSTYLEDKDLGIVGKSIFIDKMPAEANGILLRIGPGGMKPDWEAVGRFHGRLMVSMRHDSYEAAEALAASVYDALTISKSGDYTDVYGELQIIYSRPVHTPFSFPAAASGKREFLINLDICYHSL